MHQHVGVEARIDKLLSHPRGSPRHTTLSQRGAQRVSHDWIDAQDPSGVWREESFGRSGRRRVVEVSGVGNIKLRVAEMIFMILKQIRRVKARLVTNLSVKVSAFILGIITNDSTRKQNCKDQKYPA